MSNRVEELESQVAELQAAVDGLTEELVETRERLRKLEDAAETADEADRSERVTPGGDVDPTTADGEDPDREVETEEPAAETEPAADSGTESTDGDESSSESDGIIIA